MSAYFRRSHRVHIFYNTKAGDDACRRGQILVAPIQWTYSWGDDINLRRVGEIGVLMNATHRMHQTLSSLTRMQIINEFERN